MIANSHICNNEGFSHVDQNICSLPYSQHRNTHALTELSQYACTFSQTFLCQDFIRNTASFNFRSFILLPKVTSGYTYEHALIESVTGLKDLCSEISWTDHYLEVSTQKVSTNKPILMCRHRPDKFLRSVVVSVQHTSQPQWWHIICWLDKWVCLLGS
jgi:hypothetical protein